MRAKRCVQRATVLRAFARKAGSYNSGGSLRVTSRHLTSDHSTGGYATLSGRQAQLNRTASVRSGLDYHVSGELIRNQIVAGLGDNFAPVLPCKNERHRFET